MSFSMMWKQWAPVVARIIFGAFFLFAASSKIPSTEMFAGNVAATAAIGFPVPEISVFLAFLIEAVAGLCILLGWHTRLAAGLLVPYIALLTVLFHLNFDTQTDFGFFIDHFILMAGLLALSGYGAQKWAIRRDS